MKLPEAPRTCQQHGLLLGGASKGFHVEASFVDLVFLRNTCSGQKSHSGVIVFNPRRGGPPTMGPAFWFCFSQWGWGGVAICTQAVSH